MSHLQLVIPRQLHKEILEEQRGGTTGGHLGEDKTIQRLKEQLYWWTDVQNWCSKCHTCAARKIPAPHRHAVYSTVYTLVTQCSLSQLILWVCYLSVILETNSSLLPEIISHTAGWKVIPYQIRKPLLWPDSILVDNMLCRYSAPEHKLHSD